MKALMGFEPAHNGKINVCSAASDSIFGAIQVWYQTVFKTAPDC